MSFFSLHREMAGQRSELGDQRASAMKAERTKSSKDGTTSNATLRQRGVLV
jgi:hypothetical protein